MSKKPTPDLRDHSGTPLNGEFGKPKKKDVHVKINASYQSTSYRKDGAPPAPPITFAKDVTENLRTAGTDLDRFLDAAISHAEEIQSIAKKKFPFFVRIETGTEKMTHAIAIGKYYNARGVWHYRVLMFNPNQNNRELDCIRTNDYEAWSLTPVKDDDLLPHMMEKLKVLGKLDKQINPPPSGDAWSN